jgi:hypothetical protein
MKVIVFLVVLPCRLVRNFNHHPDDGGSMDLWNAGKLIPLYTALQPRRQPSWYDNIKMSFKEIGCDGRNFMSQDSVQWRILELGR